MNPNSYPPSQRTEIECYDHLKLIGSQLLGSAFHKGQTNHNVVRRRNMMFKEDSISESRWDVVPLEIAGV